MKLTKISILAGILIASNASLQAAVIATDGFATDGTANNGDYNTGSLNQNATPTGTTGFGDAGADPSTSTSWGPGTSDVGLYSESGMSLTHSGLTGTAQNGALGIRSNLSRNSSRALVGTVPTAPSYFLSGLVQADSDDISGFGRAPYGNGDQRNMGFMDTIGGTTYDITSSGFFLGINAHDGQVNLAVFAGGDAYDLFDISDNYDETFQIVARLDVDASGNEFLSAWYAADGATALTMGLAATDVGNIWQDSGDLDTFVAQTFDSGLRDWEPFDEMRFGTSLSDVTAIPEPSAFAVMLSMAALGCVLLRRRRA